MRDEDCLFRRLRRWYSYDIEHVKRWRREAREDFNFYNNHQWDEDVEKKLISEKRPPSEFNRIHAMVNAVVGTERNNKRKVQFIPRQVGRSIPSELLTGAADWFRDQSCANHTDSQAFKDCVIGGMGWTSVSLSYEDNPEGRPVIDHLDPFKMAWDYNASKPNLQDAERLWYIDVKPIELARELFPDVEVSDLDATWHDVPLADIGSSIESLGVDSVSKKVVTIIECRWFQRERYYRGLDLENGGLRDYSEDEYRALRRVHGEIEANCFVRKVAYKAFLGRKLLEGPERILAPRGQLGWECITGYYDNKLRCHYGIVRTAKDPQRWSNKFFSQMMHMLNCTATGGFLVEAGAFENPREAMRELTKPDGVVMMTQGALTANKLQLKPQAPFPSAYLSIFSEARDAIPNVTGLSREFMGTREVDQAGVLEEQRRQSSFNLLAELFDAIELYRIRQGKLMLHLIQNYLSDGRLIRICGDEGAQYVQLLREDIIDVEYDIIVDDAPLTPNQRDKTFGIFMQMLPVIQQILPPEVLPEIVMDFMAYSPMPATNWVRLKEKVDEALMRRQQVAMAGLSGEVPGVGGGAAPPSGAVPTSGLVGGDERRVHLPMDINR